MLPRWASRLQLSFKSLSVLRFVFIIVVVLHWFACAARMLIRPCLEADAVTGVLGDDYTHSRDWHKSHREDHACLEFEIIRADRGKSVEYFSALHWSMRALTGDADAPNLGIMILAVIAGLAGNIVTSFMIGEIAAILGNSDPASIEYKNTVDNLNAFAVEKKFPTEMRVKLREFFVSAAGMFRNVYHRKMLLALSPGLQQTIAKEEIGRYITAIPFFRYAIFRTLDIKKGTECKIKQKYASKQYKKDLFLRPAVIEAVGKDCMSYDIRYTDDFSPETETMVEHERIVCARGKDALLCMREVEMMVRELSLHVSCISFMANETMVHQDISWNDVLFIMVEGKAVVFDQDDSSIESKEIITDRHNNIVGKDVCTLLVDGRRRVRHYTAKTLTHSLVYSMQAEEFVSILESAPVWNSNLQPDFNVIVCDSFDAISSAVLRELDESNRFVQKSAESTSI